MSEPRIIKLDMCPIVVKDEETAKAAAAWVDQEAKRAIRIDGEVYLDKAARDLLAGEGKRGNL